jgi:tRNA G18 (ribose-2'-O)-methylase SpoU
VICPDLSNAENIGSVMRSASAFGYGAVAIGSRSCDPLSRKALKVSMGAPFNLPILRIDDEESDARLLKSRDMKSTALRLRGIRSR